MLQLVKHGFGTSPLVVNGEQIVLGRSRLATGRQSVSLGEFGESATNGEGRCALRFSIGHGLSLPLGQRDDNGPLALVQLARRTRMCWWTMFGTNERG